MSHTLSPFVLSILSSANSSPATFCLSKPLYILWAKDTMTFPRKVSSVVLLTSFLLINKTFDFCVQFQERRIYEGENADMTCVAHCTSKWEAPHFVLLYIPRSQNTEFWRNVSSSGSWPADTRSYTFHSLLRASSTDPPVLWALPVQSEVMC